MIIPLVLVSVLIFDGVRGQPNSTNAAEIDLETWIPPEYMLTNYPYYCSGFDDDNRPIFIVEFGKWNIRKYFEEGRDIKIFERYLDQAFYRFINGIPKEKYPPGDIPEEIAFICDMDGFTIRQMASGPTVTFILSLISKLGKIDKHVAYGFVVNLNYVAEQLFAVGRPLFGSILERVESYGPNPAKWIPKVHRTIDKEQLPPWYGGNKNHVPVAIYG